MGRAPRIKETLPDFLKWRRVTRHPLVFRGLTGSQRTPGFWGVTYTVPPPLHVQTAPRAGAFVLHGQNETTPHSVVVLAQIIDDTQARIDRIE